MSGNTAERTGFVDAVTGRPVLRHPRTGQLYVTKKGWPHFWGRTLDAVAVLVVAGSLIAVFNALVQSYALGSLSITFQTSFWAYAGAAAAIWFLVVFLYGMVCGRVGGLGDLAAGMRGVRISDGRRAGAWLGGWRTLCWSFAPLWVVLLILSLTEGGTSGGDGYTAKFTAIDLRSGLALGMPPVPDPAADPTTVPGGSRS
ncbi:hypothetical protein [Arthrobacter sp. Y-9]|uniref:hypothetical protein n=1 Tax=Arthrobacter sp. Y-9 TaxID=3039385 RepID=UPI00241E216D|nr:hypothetical protein [Arthrobacter sp. Y-9]WFR84161.1 hypothetical protein P9849_00470 [Arthrobacter sp. Y-9]